MTTGMEREEAIRRRHQSLVKKRDGLKADLDFADAHWWTGEWLDYVAGIAPQKELLNAKSYVKKGKVLEVEINSGMVVAKVQGSRKTPYQVRLYCEQPSEEQIKDIKRRLSERAIYGAMLLFGEMPEDIRDVFTAAGVSLFPSEFSKSRLMCSCPELQDVCKHIIAVLYILTSIIDNDPFMLLKLRGLEKEELLASLVSVRSDNGRNGDDAQRELREPASANAQFDSDEAAEGKKALPLDQAFYGRQDLPTILNHVKNSTPDSGDLPEARTPLFDFPLWRGESTFNETISPYYDSVRKFIRDI